MNRITWSVALLGLLACSCTSVVESNKHSAILADINSTYPDSDDLKIEINGSDVLVHFKLDDYKCLALYRNNEWQSTMKYLSVFDLSFEITDFLATAYPDAFTSKVIEKESRNGVFYLIEMENNQKIYELIFDQDGKEIENTDLYFQY
ncbi:MAG: hypothetical protein NXI20_03325 [bacterium]|nr:hypothetical protein [bacterium]